MPPHEPYAAPIARVVSFYETLSRESLSRLGEVYAGNAQFKDPFNEVVGTGPITAIFEAMFEQLQVPRFRVLDAVGDSRRACLVWVFEFQNPRLDGGRPQQIRGASWLEFDHEGRVTLHRDYWDAAEELYQKLPVVGALMRWLRRRIAH
jgi:hypothetical protein